VDEPDFHHRDVFGVNDLAPIFLDGKEVGTLEVKALLP
jgi:hypothetical protein